MAVWRYAHPGTDKHGERILIRRNSAKCTNCGDEIVSKPGQPKRVVTCQCGGLRIDGGDQWLGRSCENIYGGFTDTSDPPMPAARQPNPASGP